MRKNQKNRSLLIFLFCILTFNNTYALNIPGYEDLKKWVATAGGLFLGAIGVKYLWQYGQKQYNKYLWQEWLKQPSDLPRNNKTQSFFTKAPEWAATIGQILLGILPTQSLWKSSPIESFKFTDLPKDVQAQIITLLTLNSTAESLEIAAQTINSLAQVNKELNEKINNPQFCLDLIKYLSQKFQCSNEKVAQALQTDAAKKRLGLQKQFFEACFFDSKAHVESRVNETMRQLGLVDEIDESEQPDLFTSFFKNLYAKGADLDFTYDVMKERPGIFNFLPHHAEFNPDFPKEVTPLMIICLQSYTKLAKHDRENVFNFFFEKGNINATNNKGTTALMVTCSERVSTANMRTSLKMLIKSPKLLINQQDKEGNTALMYLLTKNMVYYSEPNVHNIQPGLISKTIEKLVDAGADPKIANSEGLTPLQGLLKMPEQNAAYTQEAVTTLEQILNK